MRCVTRTKWVRKKTNARTQTHTNTQTYRHTIQMERGRHQLADMFHSACCRVVVACGGVLAMHESTPLQNVSEMSLESVTFKKNNQHAQTQYFEDSETQFTIHWSYCTCMFVIRQMFCFGVYFRCRFWLWILRLNKNSHVFTLSHPLADQSLILMSRVYQQNISSLGSLAQSQLLISTVS